MPQDQPPTTEANAAPPSAKIPSAALPKPLTASTRHRLQKMFEHGQRGVTKRDYDYANELFAQCVAEDPSSMIYLQAFLDNLGEKHGDRKPSKLSGIKLKKLRSAMAKGAAKGDWLAAFNAGCAALAVSPWDEATLLALADACQELGINECQLYYLRWSLSRDSKSAKVNRRAAQQLARMGQFEQAIACWQRVAQAKPEDEESRQAIAQLSVEHTIHKGGYEQDAAADPGGEDQGGDNHTTGHRSIASYSRQYREAQQELPEGAEAPPELPLEQRLTQAVESDPANVEAAVSLADLHIHQNQLEDAQRVLQRANEATGGGQLLIRERLEDLQLRHARQHLQVAEQNHQAEPTPENEQLLRQIRQQTNQRELEVYAVRTGRDPNNTRLQFELGVRLRAAGKTREAITALQAARGDSKRKTAVLLGLGECFQTIEQYKLALSNYEQAVESAAEEKNVAAVGTLKLALYRAGVLATGMREFDRAEKFMNRLAELDFGYRDVAERLDKISRLRDSG